MRPLVLASTSPYRAQLLEKLGLPFTTAAPQADESRLPGESPAALVERLARAKAEAVAAAHPDALIIGSDQVACLGDEILGKPGGFEPAFEQLRAMAGRRVTFLTGLCLLDAADGRAWHCVEPFHVHLRPLGEEQIRRYLEKEQPYDCAGSFKSEGYGITLFERLEGDDPNTLVGLPLIRLVELLGRAGVTLP